MYRTSSLIKSKVLYYNLPSVHQKVFGVMSGGCPLCLEELSTPSYTPCAHAFCSHCLREWIRTGKDTCPLCRTPLQELVPMYSSQQSYSRPSLQEQMEAEHVARQSAFYRRREVEDRLSRYQSSVLTASGQSFESLELVSLAELRRLLVKNRRSMAVPSANGFD